MPPKTAKAFHGGEEGKGIDELGVEAEAMDEDVEGGGVGGNAQVDKVIKDGKGNRGWGGGADEGIEEDILGAEGGAKAAVLHGLEELLCEVGLAKMGVRGDYSVKEGLRRGEGGVGVEEVAMEEMRMIEGGFRSAHHKGTAKAFHGGEEGEGIDELGMKAEAVDEDVEGGGVRGDSEVDKIMEDGKGDRGWGGRADEGIEEDVPSAEGGAKAVVLHGLEELLGDVRLAETGIGEDCSVEECLRWGVVGAEEVMVEEMRTIEGDEREEEGLGISKFVETEKGTNEHEEGEEGGCGVA